MKRPFFVKTVADVKPGDFVATGHITYTDYNTPRQRVTRFVTVDGYRDVRLHIERVVPDAHVDWRGREHVTHVERVVAVSSEPFRLRQWNQFNLWRFSIAYPKRGKLAQPYTERMQEASVLPAEPTPVVDPKPKTKRKHPEKATTIHVTEEQSKLPDLSVVEPGPDATGEPTPLPVDQPTATPPPAQQAEERQEEPSDSLAQQLADLQEDAPPSDPPEIIAALQQEERMIEEQAAVVGEPAPPAEVQPPEDAAPTQARSMVQDFMRSQATVGAKNKELAGRPIPAARDKRRY